MSNRNKSIFFVLIAVILYMVIHVIGKHVYPHYPQRDIKINRLLENASSFKSITIGHSHGCSIDYKELGRVGYHVWEGSNDFSESEYQLRAILPLLPNVKEVFFVISPGHFYFYNNLGSDRAEVRRIYYSLLPGDEYVENDFRNYLVAQTAPVVRSDHWKPYITGVKTEGDLFTDTGKLDLKETFSKERLEKTYEVFDGWTKLFAKRQASKIHDIFQYNVRMLKKIITLTKEKNIRLILYTPPYTHAYLNLLETNCPEVLKEFDRTLKSISEEEKIKYYDFSRTLPFNRNNTPYFADQTHLTREGSRLFSQQFKKIMDKDGLLPF